MKRNEMAEVADKSFIESFANFSKDIKLAHSIFALPFAACGLIFSNPHLPSLGLIFKLVLCMVMARTFAMGMNRYLDWEIDLANPRTKTREIPSGRINKYHSLSWSLLAAGIFLLAAFSINKLTGILGIPLLVILMCYSYMKRVSWLCHWYLGVCLGLAPIAASVALGQLNLSVILLGIGVMFWTAGFDILYATQDYQFDRENSYFSIPAHFGLDSAVWTSRLCFFLMIVFLWVAGELIRTGFIYRLGLVAISFLLFYEHWLIKDLSTKGKSEKINAAFFNVNSWVSVVFYLFTQLDTIIE